jgi:Coenzyme PQQ synthesis protein D (PqqD)
VSRWERTPHVLWRRSLDAVHFVPPGADEPLTLAGTGPELWALLTDPCDADDIITALAEYHGAAPDVVADDVRPLLEQLERLGVVRRVEPGDAE